MTEYWDRGARIVLDMGCARDKGGKWCILTKSTAMQIEIKTNIAFEAIFDIIQMASLFLVWPRLIACSGRTKCKNLVWNANDIERH